MSGVGITHLWNIQVVADFVRSFFFFYSVFRNMLKSVHLEMSTPHLPRQEGYCKISPLPPPALPPRTDSLEMWYSVRGIACKSGSSRFITLLFCKQEYISVTAISCLNIVRYLRFCISYWSWRSFTADINQCYLTFSQRWRCRCNLLGSR
jgi:hypothetical protein